MLRISIRDVLWLTVVVSLAVGWSIEHGHNAPLRQRCDRLVALAENSTKVLQAFGIDAEFRDDNIHIGGYHFERPTARSPEVLSR
jgi:hypothetical protein